MIDVTELRDVIIKQGSVRAAERWLREQGMDISARTIQRRLQAEEIDVDDAPVYVDVDELIAERLRKFKRLQKATEAGRVRTVRVRTNAPIGVGFMGDAHIDDDGTNIEKLLLHADLFDGSQEGLYAAFLGDVWNNWVGRLTRLWADQSTNAKEAQALVEHFFAKVRWLFALQGNHDCVDFATEALTKRGWVSYPDLRDDDEVLGFNPKTFDAEWQPILRKLDRANSDQMVRIQNRHVDMCVTPNHRVLYANQKTSNWQYAQAETLVAGIKAIRCGAFLNQSDASLSDDEIRLAGWLVTDAGRDARGAWTIYQSKFSQVEEIRALLGRLNLSFTERCRQRDITHICGKELKAPPLPSYEFYLQEGERDYCDALVPDRTVLPKWVLTLSPRQFDILLGVIVAADGTWDGVDPDAHNCAVVHKGVAFLDSLQAAAVCFGWRATQVNYRETSFRLNLARRSESNVTLESAFSREAAVDRVWCLTVPLTNFMVRRNGKAYFTGNCWNGKTDILEYMLAAQTNIVAPHEQRVRLVFPNGREVLIHARHKFPGTSQWTKQFGQIKAAMLGGDADIYVGGDKHVSGYSNGWHDAQKRMWHAIQVASYKEIDDYPIELGLQCADLYQCPVAIIDPTATGPLNFIRFEFDPVEGAKRVAWLRSRL